MTRLRGEPPRFTPADRLEALDRVASAARVQLQSADDDAWFIATDELATRVAELDKIELYLGKPGAAA